MKKSIASIGLLALVMVLTSFTTPETATVSLNNDSAELYGGATNTTRKSDLYGGATNTTRKSDLYGGATNTTRKSDLIIFNIII